MSRRSKLLARMRLTPGKIRFAEIDALLRYFGFVVKIVKPHGRHTTCDPADIRHLLEVLGQ